MKRIYFYISLVLSVMVSCSTAERGASNGAMFGSIIGSAVGGLTGGPRGSDIGTLAGMAGGAVLGGVVGNANEKSRNGGYKGSEAQVNNETDDYNYGQSKSRRSSDKSNIAEAVTPLVLMSNVHIKYSGNDGVIRRGDSCELVFDITNYSDETLYNIVPDITISGTKHLCVSPAECISSIGVGDKARYTAIIQSDNKLKNGTATIFITMLGNDDKALSRTSKLSVETNKNQ